MFTMTATKKWTGLLFLALAFAIQGCSHAGNPGKTKPARPDLRLEIPDIVTVTGSGKPHVVYFLLAETHKRKGDMNRALVYLQKAEEADRESLFLKKELARLHVQRNELPEALRILEAGLKDHPDHIEFLGVLAQIKLIQNKDNEVPAIFEKILAATPEDQALYFLLGTKSIRTSSAELQTAVIYTL